MTLETVAILTDFVLIFSLSIGIVFLFHKLRIVPIVGYLVTGVIIGPSVIGLVKDQTMIELFAEIGVILLLFTIGIEFSLQELIRSRRTIVMGGGMQVLLTIVVVTLIALAAGQSMGIAIFLGFLVSMSSTAIVLRILSERAEMESPNGRVTISILIFQDLGIILMVLLVPLLAGTAGTSSSAMIFSILKALAIVLLLIVAGRFIVPTVLYHIVRTQNRELFLLGMIVICLGTATLTSMAGLSLAIGAFIIGLIISESEFSHQALSEILPLRDVFNSLFFISIGMLLDLGFVLDNFSIILYVVIIIILIKFMLTMITTVVLKYPIHTAFLVGLSLAQIGEFSFVLSLIGIQHGLLNNDIYQVFLASAILTMIATPFMIQMGPRIEDFITRHGKESDHIRKETIGSKIEKHVVIAGYGINGRNLSSVLSAVKIPFVVVEMNPEIVISEKRKGLPIFYGDASKEDILKLTNISKAKILVVAICDAAHTRMMVKNARKLNPGIYIITRIRYVSELEELYELGADEVIPAEFETSIEIFSRVLSRYLIPKEEIQKNVERVRKDGYEMIRDIYHRPRSLDDLGHHLTNIELETFRVMGGSIADGKTLAELNLRKQWGFTVLAIQRGNDVLNNPDGEDKLLEDDIVVLMGNRERLHDVSSVFAAS
ncbi:MAG: potassium transporter KefB [ANME-2 cluster archaeon]|nr:potassium transporter KefB [ANME-2 cluster archaeon]MBC2701840.1 potassium transporter KefB [ANME-2 cluster archaeon]MBC2707305.1 potassium transporter KefB [ANME-2 cluster archaeon]